MAYDSIPDAAEKLAAAALECCFQVHRRLGPGLLERVYEECLCYELTRADIPFRRQAQMAIHYDELTIDGGLVIDIFVGEQVILELKAVEELHPIHQAQLLTYLRLTDTRLGFLVNFNTKLLKNGIVRRVN